MSRGKKRLKAVHVPKRDHKVIIKPDPAKRKMPPEELKAYLRESGRGCGIHGLESNKTQRRKAKQASRRENYENTK